MDISALGIEAMPVIVVLAYFVGVVVHKSPLDNKYIPAICGGVGGVLGVVAMYVMPEFPANDILTALAVGIVSGFAATGIDQVAKYLARGRQNKAASK